MKIINRFLDFIIFLLLLFFSFTVGLNYLFSTNNVTVFDNLLDENNNTINDYDEVYGIGDFFDILEDKKDFGNTGDNYAFDEKYYKYYYLLNDDEKLFYRQIYGNTLDLKNTFNPIVDITKDRISYVFQSVLFDHPELFWLDNNYSYKYNGNNICTSITTKFNSTIDDFDNNSYLFNNELNNIINNANKYYSDLDKEKYVYDYLVNNLNYNPDNNLNQSAYSALVMKDSVCAGYSRLFQLVMTRLNIPCFFITGDSYGNHAWNIIYINNKYYNIDITWENTGRREHEYFNKSDYEFNNDHIRSDMSLLLPECI